MNEKNEIKIKNIKDQKAKNRAKIDKLLFINKQLDLQLQKLQTAKENPTPKTAVEKKTQSETDKKRFMDQFSEFKKSGLAKSDPSTTFTPK